MAWSPQSNRQLLPPSTIVVPLRWPSSLLSAGWPIRADSFSAGLSSPTNSRCGDHCRQPRWPFPGVSIITGSKSSSPAALSIHGIGYRRRLAALSSCLRYSSPSSWIRIRRLKPKACASIPLWRHQYIIVKHESALIVAYYLERAALVIFISPLLFSSFHFVRVRKGTIQLIVLWIWLI